MEFYGYSDGYGYDNYHTGYPSTSRSGLSRQRHFYTEPQLRLLEAEFAREPFPSQERRRRISQHLQVSERSVLWWFQNRRRRLRQQGGAKSSQNQFVARRCRPVARSSPYSSPYAEPHQYNGGQNGWINELELPQCSPEVVQSMLSSIKALPVLTSLDLDLICNDFDADSTGFPSPSTESPVTTPSSDCWPYFPNQFTSPVTTPGSDSWPAFPTASHGNQFSHGVEQKGDSSVCNLDAQHRESCQTESQVNQHLSYSTYERTGRVFHSNAQHGYSDQSFTPSTSFIARRNSLTHHVSSDAFVRCPAYDNSFQSQILDESPLCDGTPYSQYYETFSFQ